MTAVLIVIHLATMIDVAAIILMMTMLMATMLVTMMILSVLMEMFTRRMVYVCSEDADTGYECHGFAMQMMVVVLRVLVTVVLMIAPTYVRKMLEVLLAMRIIMVTTMSPMSAVAKFILRATATAMIMRMWMGALMLKMTIMTLMPIMITMAI